MMGTQFAFYTGFNFFRVSTFYSTVDNNILSLLDMHV